MKSCPSLPFAVSPAAVEATPQPGWWLSCPSWLGAAFPAQQGPAWLCHAAAAARMAMGAFAWVNPGGRGCELA